MGSVLGVAVCTTATAAQPVTLETLLDHASRRSPVLTAERTALPEAEAGRRGAWSAWRPDLSAGGQGRWSSVEAELDLGDIVRGIAPALGVDPEPLLADFPPPTQIQPRWSAVGSVTLRQLVFDPSALYGPRIAAAGVDAAEAAVRAAERDVLFTLARLALGIESLDGIEEAAERALEVAERRLDEAGQRMEAGVATGLDVSRAKTAQMEAARELAAVQAQRARMLADLVALSGWEGELSAVDAGGLSRLLADGKGADTRPELARARAGIRGAEEALASAEYRWLPSVMLEGNVNWASFGGFADQQLTAGALVGIQIPLYDGGRRYADADKARAQLDRARASSEALLLNLRAEVKKAEATLSEAKAQLELARAQLETAEQAVQQTEQLTAEGMATSLDLRTADARRFAADRALTERKLALSLAELGLARARGASWMIENDGERAR